MKKFYLISSFPADRHFLVHHVPGGASAFGGNFFESTFQKTIVLRIVLEEAQVAIVGEVADLVLDLSIPFSEAFGTLKMV